MTEAAEVSSPAGVEPFMRAVISAVVLLLVVRAAEPLFFGDGFYGTLSIHPFWILIILVATQHGCFAGVVAAAIAALLMDWPPRPTGVDITEHYVELAVLPVQWLLAALVIGLFRQGQLRREAALADENVHLRQVTEDLADEIDRMDREIEALELAAATRQAGFRSHEGLDNAIPPAATSTQHTVSEANEEVADDDSILHQRDGNNRKQYPFESIDAPPTGELAKPRNTSMVQRHALR